MDYAEAVAWLYGRQALGIKLGLEKVHKLLGMVGNPQAGLNIVHVAGTNGKGSVCALIAAALQEAGHKVGRFTSPHLVRFTERILIDGAEITREQVTDWVHKLQKPTAELDGDGEHPTFFELVTAMAFMHFQHEGVQWAVLETGLGGRLDATNVVQPKLSVITHIGMDHEAFLGPTIQDVAREKAGIMKAGVPCVTSASGSALQVLNRTSQDLQVPMSILGQDYHVLPDLNGIRLVHPAGEAHYDVALAGEHQVENAALAVVACDALRARGYDIPMDAVQRALAKTTVPGRMEHLPAAEGRHDVLLDGAHNLDGAVALRRHFAHREMSGFQLVVGFSADKDWESMINQWAPLAAHVHGVPLRSTRSLEPESMRAAVEGIGIPFTVHDNASAAVAAATKEGETVVAGSLFLVGEARAFLLGESMEDIRGSQ